LRASSRTRRRSTRCFCSCCIGQLRTQRADVCARRLSARALPRARAHHAHRVRARDRAAGMRALRSGTCLRTIARSRRLSGRQSSPACALRRLPLRPTLMGHPRPLRLRRCRQRRLRSRPTRSSRRERTTSSGRSLRAHPS
jgi:hypothetical protein